MLMARRRGSLVVGPHLILGRGQGTTTMDEFATTNTLG